MNFRNHRPKPGVVTTPLTDVLKWRRDETFIGVGLFSALAKVRIRAKSITHGSISRLQEKFTGCINTVIIHLIPIL